MNLLTTKNIKTGLWIIDPSYGLSQVMHIHKPTARFINEIPFTYKVYNGHYCHTSATQTGQEYKLFIVPSYKVYIKKQIKLLKDIIKTW